MRITIAIILCVLSLLLTACGAGVGLAQARRDDKATLVIEDSQIPLANASDVEEQSQEEDPVVNFDKLGEKVDIYGVGIIKAPEADDEELMNAIRQVLIYYNGGDAPTDDLDRYPPLPSGSSIPADITLDDIRIERDYFFYAYAAMIDVGGGKEMLMGIEYTSDENWQVAAVMYREV